MKTGIKNIAFCCCLIIAINAYAQIICQETKEKIALNSGNSVYVYQEKNTTDSPTYYYVPTQLNLSESKGQPEYSLLEYKNSGSVTPDGAILHMLITWGLNNKELSELRQCIKHLYGSSATLSGALYLNNEASGITINTNTKTGQILNSALQSKGVPPTLSNGKMALSFRLKKEEVKIIREAIKNKSGFSKTLLKINYSYNTNTCKGSISLAKKNELSLEGHLQNWF